jgi:hypothetical protein
MPDVFVCLEVAKQQAAIQSLNLGPVTLQEHGRLRRGSVLPLRVHRLFQTFQTSGTTQCGAVQRAVMSDIAGL